MKTITERIAETSQNIRTEYLNARPPFPKKVKIEITNQCNLKCFYCQHSYDDTKKSQIDEDFLFNLLKELKLNGVEEVGLFWMGEPLMNNNLPDYIAFAKEIGIEYVFITTNGILATPERINKIFDSGLDSIKFSLNASNRKKYHKICGVDAFEIVIKNIMSSWEIRGERKTPSIYSSSIYDPNEKEEYEAIKKMISPYVDEHYPLRLYGSHKVTGKDDSLAIVPSEKHEMRSLQSMLPCWPMFTEPHISSDGFMSACYCDRSPRLFMGDLKKQSFLEVWHSEKFVALRKNHLQKNVAHTVCEECIAYSKS